MGSHPNLASRSEVVSIQMPHKNFGGPPSKFGAQKNIIYSTTFLATSALDIPYLQNETSHIDAIDKPKYYCQFAIVSPTSSTYFP